MAIRPASLALAAFALVASISSFAGAHFQARACNGEVSTDDVGGQVVYTDWHNDEGLPVPAPFAQEFWIYLETNGHPGLQTGGDHFALGEGGDIAGLTDDCKATHGIDNGYDSIVF